MSCYPREHKTRDIAHPGTKREITDDIVTTYSFRTGAKSGIYGSGVGRHHYSILAFNGRELGKEVDSLAQRFNQANPDYKIVPVYKGNYEQNLSAGIAAFRTGNAPAILQVYEVGTATMMASKAIKPVYEMFKDAGINFDESQFVPTVAGYYTDAKSGHLLSQPFNSSTPVLYYNKDAFKKAGLDPEQPPKTWQELADYTAKLRAAGMKCGYASGWQG